ncbi:MAG: carbamoyltransferase HypF [Sulfurospirillaceae bacterium]|nr:carbamoyltransferase HypF [Sulfurospirillaceae bacterium]
MTRFCYRIEGIVQGVGFRPFVYTLALKHRLCGYVLNDTTGVEMELEGKKEDIELFDKEFQATLPPLARVDFIEKNEKPIFNFVDFRIEQSSSQVSKYSLVSPDMSLCDDCLKELKDSSNFRYQYPFINCTNCGPRYSIVKTIPYDRQNTSMATFAMCENCRSEYIDPLNRRYHAQPISCPKCGPSAFLKNIKGDILEHGNKAIERLAELINEGFIVAMKGMGGFHLICDATNKNAVEKLRLRKKRPTKPFAVMFKDISSIEKECILSNDEKNAILLLKRPIVLVKRKQNDISKIDFGVAPNIDRLGVFLPYTPLHVMLFEYLKNPIIATSANASGEPIATSSLKVQEALHDVVDFYLDYNRDIVNASDDSVMQIVGDKTLFLRMSRGYTPASFRFESDEKRKILALGAHQKNAIAIYMDNQIILSPYIGDLDSVENIHFFEKTVQSFKNFYDFEPDIIVCDKHPNYTTTRWAKAQNKPSVQIQHHYAHILACMFEHKIDEQVLGVAWDGTGYGDDGTIWGGEFLLCTKKTYERVAYFEPFLLLGGDASIKDIRRILLSILLDSEYEKSLYQPFFDKFENSELKLLKQAHEKRINSPLCSSVGRIFDAVAVACGICERVSYDGESGLLLEKFYNPSITDAYSIYLDGKIIRYKHIFDEIRRDNDVETIVSKFINALANIIILLSGKYAKNTYLSGGVFQNRTLLESILSRKTSKIFFHNHLPSNDGSIALGQLFSLI